MRKVWIAVGWSKSRKWRSTTGNRSQMKPSSMAGNTCFEKHAHEDHALFSHSHTRRCSLRQSSALSRPELSLVSVPWRGVQSGTFFTLALHFTAIEFPRWTRATWNWYTGTVWLPSLLALAICYLQVRQILSPRPFHNPERLQWIKFILWLDRWNGRSIDHGKGRIQLVSQLNFTHFGFPQRTYDT